MSFYLTFGEEKSEKGGKIESQINSPWGNDTISPKKNSFGF